ncbi:MAG: hypothetical protein ACKPKO_11985, partial [Candidatus Fonsibacter sp.]
VIWFNCSDTRLCCDQQQLTVKKDPENVNSSPCAGPHDRAAAMTEPAALATMDVWARLRVLQVCSSTTAECNLNVVVEPLGSRLFGGLRTEAGH